MWKLTAHGQKSNSFQSWNPRRKASNCSSSSLLRVVLQRKTTQTLDVLRLSPSSSSLLSLSPHRWLSVLDSSVLNLRNESPEGLGDEKDITLRGLEAVKKCDKVYIEAYTSLLSFGHSSNGLSTLEELYGRSIILADREMVEEGADGILSEARESNVAFLVVGDPFGATTHTDLVVRAKKLGVEVKVIHNASVMNAVGVCGLQLYRYGETVSIPFFTETWRPDSFYEKILSNRTIGLHTLCLLDIRVKEPTLESLCRGRKQYEPPKYMTIGTAIEQLLEVEQTRGQSAYSEETTCVGLARLGSEDQMVVAGSMKELQTVDFGAPLHSLVIVGKTHPIEEEILDFYTPKRGSP